jgi:hypothetical protein
MLALVLVILLGALGGCATAYQSTGFTGGYSDLQLAPDVYRVSFKGNAFTQRERVLNLALLRAAELALSRGAYGLEVLDQERMR